MNSTAAKYIHFPAAKVAPRPAAGSGLTSVCFKKIDDNNGVLLGVSSRFYGFVNASMDDHKACITSSYNKLRKQAAGKIIKCIASNAGSAN